MTPEEREKAVHTLTKFCENHVCYECLFDNDDDCLMPNTETAIDRVLQAAVDRIRERRPVTADQSATDRDEYQKTEIGWIPISKDQPKTNGQYLTTTMYGEVYGDYWRGGCFDRSETIIAWAPMPEPYKWDREKDRQNYGKMEG